MNKGIDLLLVNSFAPRQRIASDAALENSLAILRTYLEDHGFAVYVIDEQRVSGAEKGIPKFLVQLLRVVVKLQISAYSIFKPLALLMMLLAWPVHSLALYCRKQYMEQLIATIVKLVQTDNIPVVGIKVWNGDAYKWSMKLANSIRQASPETTVIAGGPQVKVYGERIFDQPAFDLAIMGPGEEILETLLTKRKTSADKKTFLEYVRREISPTPLIRTGNYSIQDNTQPGSFIVPRYQPADLHDKILLHTLVDGLGCTWNKCNFCSHTRQNMRYIPRPVDQIRDEITTMTKQGIAFFRFASSETSISQGSAIAKMLLENRLTINYSMFVRAGKISQQTYEAYCLMIQAGLRAVFMGGETGHDVINATVMNKGVTRQDIIDTIQCIKLAAAAVGAPCKVGLALIYPCPVCEGVTLEDVYQANLALIAEALPDTIIINPPGVFPETTWFEQAEKFGFRIGDDLVSKLMEYEFSMYKPVEFWADLDYSLNGQNTKALLKETVKLRKAIEAMGIPIGISDEYLMMTEAIGCRSQLDLLEFKQQSLLDIMSGSAQYLTATVEKINTQSRKLANTNPHMG